MLLGNREQSEQLAVGSGQRAEGNLWPLAFSLSPSTWVIWLLTMAVAVMQIRNPLYTIVLLLVVTLVRLACAKHAGIGLNLWRMGGMILLFSAVFNGAFTHFGDTVLLTLPKSWPLIGGVISAEAVAFGLANGLILFTLLVTFITFNEILDSAELVRLTPPAFQDLGIVVLIAITYIPETKRHWQRIQDAQAIRGHVTRGIRDWPPLLLPLLIGGLERALNLAEAMVARGYGRTASKQQPVVAQLLLLLGLLFAFVGWIVAIWGHALGWLLVGMGVTVMVALVWQKGRGIKRTHYNPRRMRLFDYVVCALCGVVLLAIRQLGGSVGFSPYPGLSLPVFEPVLSLILLLLVAPVLAILNSE